MLLLDKLIGHVVPIRFVAFGLVGSIGIFVHLTAVTLLFKGVQLGFMSSQFISSIIAMTTNFILNNSSTYNDLRLSGWRWLRGWVTFVLACGIGTIANVWASQRICSSEMQDRPRRRWPE
jgi:dolichol-phosphate mannosyltransferase